MNYIEACMNPIRQRIIQFLATYGSGTAAKILEELNDIPRASLYRHIKILLDSKVINVVSEEEKRGTIEKTYSLVMQDASEFSNEQMGLMFQSALMNLASVFMKYFSDPHADPVKDLLSIGSATILMTDDEYIEFLKAYSSLLQKAASNKMTDGRKTRNVTFISAPELSKGN